MGILHGHVVTFTRDFCALQRPNSSMKAQLQDLLLEYQSRLSPDDLKTLCRLLADNEHAPKALLITLCKRSARICHSLLLLSNVLNANDLIDIIDLKGLAHARVIARRRNIDPALKAHLHNLNDTRIDQALELRQMPLQPTASQGSMQKNIQLRTVNHTLDEAFSQLSKENDLSFIYTAFVDNLSLEFVSVRNLCSDFKSRNLPIALHFLRLSLQTAWQIFERLACDTDINDDIRDQFFKTYESLDYSISVATVKSWQKDDMKAQQIYNSAANQSNVQSTKKIAG